MNTGSYPVQEEQAEMPEDVPQGGETSASSSRRPDPADGPQFRDAHAQRVIAAQRSEALNRLLNVFIAVLALIILAPVMLLIALAVKVTSHGPVFYVQDRVGVDRRRRYNSPGEDRRKSNVGGRPFRILKFRSMRQDA